MEFLKLVFRWNFDFISFFFISTLAVAQRREELMGDKLIFIQLLCFVYVSTMVLRLTGISPIMLNFRAILR